MDRHSAADRLARKLQCRTLAQGQHGLVEDPCHHIDVLPQMSQNLPGVFRGVVIGNQLELNAGTVLLNLGPQVHQYLGRRHGGCANAKHFLFPASGISGTGDGVFAILHDIPGVLGQRAPGLCENQPSMGAGEQSHPQAALQQIDLLDHSGRGDVQPLRRLVEAACFYHRQKRVQLRIVHGFPPFFLTYLPYPYCI